MKDPIIDYINQFPVEVRMILEGIRDQVTKAIPDATEKISYQMPSLRKKKVFFYYGAFKNHIGIYPPLNQHPDLIERTAKYRNEKGNLSFPYKEAIPYDLILEVARALDEEYNQ